MATVRELLDAGVARLRESGSDTARLDSELLLAHALDVDRTGVIANWAAPVGEGAATRYRELLERRAAGEPVAYIRGVKEFRGLAFGVDERALIPRPETEKLVELAEVEIVKRLIADLLPGDREWDVVLANLPYVRTDAIPNLPKATSFEPVRALDGGADGLQVIARLLEQLPDAVARGGAALLEIGGDQEHAFRDLAAARLRGWELEIERDLGGLPRVAVLRHP